MIWDDEDIPVSKECNTQNPQYYHHRIIITPNWKEADLNFSAQIAQDL